MSSNTTFSSQGNFNRPAITKLKPQKEIVNNIVLGSTIILLLISFIDSISHYFVGNVKQKAPSYFSMYIIVVSAIFIFSFINMIKNFNKEKDAGLSQTILIINILYVVGAITFIIILNEVNHNIKYIKQSLWDFSGLSKTDTKQKLSLCISAYFGDSIAKSGEWLGISILTFILSIIMLISLMIPSYFKHFFKIGIIFVVPLVLYYTGWYKTVHSAKANITCPTIENN